MKEYARLEVGPIGYLRRRFGFLFSILAVMPWTVSIR